MQVTIDISLYLNREDCIPHKALYMIKIIPNDEVL